MLCKNPPPSLREKVLPLMSPGSLSLSHFLLSFLRGNYYPDCYVYRFLDFLYGFTTYVYDPEHIIFL